MNGREASRAMAEQQCFLVFPLPSPGAHSQVPSHAGTLAAVILGLLIQQYEPGYGFFLGKGPELTSCFNQMT